MHIAIDARIINSTTGRYVERLLTHLQEIDYKNTYSILVPAKDRDFWTPTNPNFTVVTVEYKNYSFNEQIGFKHFLDTLHPDLVHFCMPQQPVLYKGIHVTTIHDLTLLKTWNTDKNWLIYHLKQLVGRFVFHAVINSSQVVITDSEFSRREIESFEPIAKNKTSVIYLGADASIIELEEYKQPFSNFILYVGAQSDYKNIPRLAEAHQALIGKHPDLGLILVGKKNVLFRKNEASFKKRGFKNIIFTDYIPDHQRDWLYKNCSAYVFPSLMEGFGLPGLEAMLYGAPVVSSNATCLPEVYGEAAHYFDPTNSSDMARAIDDILSNPSLRESLISEGYTQVGKYSWRRMAEETHAIYMQVLNKHSD